MKDKGLDGGKLIEQAKALVAKYDKAVSVCRAAARASVAARGHAVPWRQPGEGSR